MYLNEFGKKEYGVEKFEFELDSETDKKTKELFAFYLELLERQKLAIESEENNQNQSTETEKVVESEKELAQSGQTTEPIIPTYDGSIVNGTSGAVYWDLYVDSGNLVIHGIGTMDNYDKGSDVPWYNYCEKIKKVEIVEGVRNVGSWALYDCSNLTEVVLPESITSIDSHAFRDCSSLEYITLPETLESIGFNSFNGCHALKEITIPDSVQGILDLCFYDTGLQTAVIGDGIASLQHTFQF